MTTTRTTTPKLGAKGGKIRAGGKPGRSDPRGNSYTRRARKEWMLKPESGFGGTGTEVLCTHCHTPLNYDTVEADRKEPGGPYARHNIQPACRSCNLSRSNKEHWTPPKAQQG